MSQAIGGLDIDRDNASLPTVDKSKPHNLLRLGDDEQDRQYISDAA